MSGWFNTAPGPDQCGPYNRLAPLLLMYSAPSFGHSWTCNIKSLRGQYGLGGERRITRRTKGSRALSTLIDT